MHADQRRAIAGTLADVEIGHVIAIDVKGLHGDLVRDERGPLKGAGENPRSSEVVHAVKFPQVSGG
jgi:hypothetical protein